MLRLPCWWLALHAQGMDNHLDTITHNCPIPVGRSTGLEEAVCTGKRMLRALSPGKSSLRCAYPLLTGSPYRPSSRSFKYRVAREALLQQIIPQMDDDCNNGILCTAVPVPLWFMRLNLPGKV